MDKTYVMGVDVGTHAKLVFFDLNGTMVCEAGHLLQKLLIPAPLLAEPPDDDRWEALKKALRKATHRFEN